MNCPFAFIGNMSPAAIILIVLLVVLLFGGSKLPELARGLGKARREFKRASDEIEDEMRSAIEEDERKEARRRIMEEEERSRIRSQVEAEERAKIEAERSKENN